MRGLFAPLALLLLIPWVGAQSALPASAEIVPYRHFDENGILVDLSGNGEIWAAVPHQHAILQVQVIPQGASRPAAQLGSITRWEGVEGAPIRVDSLSEGVVIHPTADQGGWVTDEHGVFQLSVGVPVRTGDHQFVFRTDDPDVSPLLLTMQVRSANWVLWLTLGLLGGLAIFLHGMTTASNGLQEGAGHRLRDTLQRLTDRPLRGLAVGTLATLLTQSSSATTVMLVGFVRAGLLTLRQSFSPIFGAAIGTTLTVQLLAFRIQDQALPIIAAGAAVMYFGRQRPKTASAGKVVFGFGLIFFGMAVMGDVLEPLKSSPGFAETLTRLTSRPVTCTIIATIFTALVQSSGATLGIALTLANAGLLDVHEALPIIYGANIGTCITAMLASMGGSADGKRVALAHLLFKVGGVVIFIPWFMSNLLAWMAIESTDLMVQAFAGGDATGSAARELANAHTLFSVITAVGALLIGQRPLELVVRRLVPDDPAKGEGRAKFLDDSLLDSPTLALGATKREISRMARLVEEMVKKSADIIRDKDPEVIQWLLKRDDKVDRAFARINKYLTQLTARRPSQEESERAIAMLYIINDLESLGDLVVKTLIPLINKMIENDLEFSEGGLQDILGLHARIVDSMTKTMIAFADLEETELFEEVVRRQEDMQSEGRRLHLRHLKRLQEGQRESIQTSTIHLDVISCLLRMHYLCHSIAWTASRGVSAHEEMTG